MSQDGEAPKPMILAQGGETREEETPQEDLQRGNSVLGFFTLEGLNRGLTAGEYAVEDEISILAEIAKNDTNPITRMAAVKMIRRHLKEALIMTGGLSQQTARQIGVSPDGHQLVGEVTRYQLSGLGRRTELLLQQAHDVGEVYALESKPLEARESGAEEPQDMEGVTHDPEQPENQPRRLGEPERDLGGGGLCLSAQKAAAEAQKAAHQAPQALEVPAVPGEASGTPGEAGAAGAAAPSPSSHGDGPEPPESEGPPGHGGP